MEFRQAFDPARSLGSIFKLVPQAWVTLLLGGVLISFLDSGGPSTWLEIEIDEVRSWPVLLPPLAALAGAGCFGLFCWLIACRMQIGYAGALQRVMVTGEDDFSDLWHDRGLWGSMILARLLKYLVGAFGALPGLAMFLAPMAVVELTDGPREVGVVIGVLFSLLFLPFWIYVLLGFALVEQVVAIEQRSPIEALRRSWEVARGNRLPLLWFSIVLGMFSLVGMCLCFVGVYATSACAQAAWYEAYLRYATKPPAEGMWVDGTRTVTSEGDGVPADWKLGSQPEAPADNGSRDPL